MEILDVTVPVREGMVIYAGNPGVRLERVQSIAAEGTNVSRLDAGVHTGTHVDAPVHFLPDGAGADEIPLRALIGPAEVVDATAVEDALDESALRSVAPPRVERILFKTRNSRLWGSDEFTRDFVRLTGDGAAFLVGRGVKLVGIDYLSVGDREAHRVLLGAGVIPLEGLDLRAVEPGPYELVCLPLRLVGADGAPARALLVRNGPGRV